MLDEDGSDGTLSILLKLATSRPNLQALAAECKRWRYELWRQRTSNSNVSLPRQRLASFLTATLWHACRERLTCREGCYVALFPRARATDSDTMKMKNGRVNTFSTCLTWAERKRSEILTLLWLCATLGSWLQHRILLVQLNDVPTDMPTATVIVRQL